jgi:pyruvyltransferase
MSTAEFSQLPHYQFAAAMNVYWEKCGTGAGNFGDTLTALILDYVNVPYQWSSAERAELFGIGSIVQAIPDGFTGIVWTSGQICEPTRKDLRQAQVLALRGPRTLECTQCAEPDAVVLGDGGLLCDLFHRPAPKRFKLGIIPHYVHAADPIVAAIAATSDEITLIDVCDSALEVIQRIGQCQHILSSSLHGLIVADSLGIPSEWLNLSGGAGPVIGAGFKFRDYFEVFGIEDKRPLSLSPTDGLDTLLPRISPCARPGIDRIKATLLESLHELPRHHGGVLWSRSDLDIATREARALSQLGGDFLPHSAIASPNQHARPDRALTPLSQAHELRSSGALRLARLFRDCLHLLRQLRDKGISHRAISPDTLLVRDGKPLLADFGWSIADSQPLFQPEPQSQLRGRADRDLQAMAGVFDQINAHLHPSLDPIIQLMACPDGALRVRDLDALDVLFQVVVQDSASPGSLPCSGGEQGEGLCDVSTPHGSVPIDAAVLQTLVANIGVRSQRMAANDAERSALEVELWSTKRLLAAREVAEVVPPGQCLIMVDEDQLSIDALLADRRRIPFTEREGCYAGPPPDDDGAIAELERLRGQGAAFVAFAWMAFWWLDYYQRFARHLSVNYSLVHAGDRVVIYDLRRHGANPVVARMAGTRKTTVDL